MTNWQKNFDKFLGYFAMKKARTKLFLLFTVLCSHLLDVCSFLFPFTYSNNDRTRKVLNLILYPFARWFSRFFAMWNGNKDANHKSGGCNHFFTYFARSRLLCSLLRQRVQDFRSHGKRIAAWSSLPCATYIRWHEGVKALKNRYVGLHTYVKRVLL